jgi:hypothetical protein
MVPALYRRLVVFALFAALFTIGCASSNLVRIAEVNDQLATALVRLMNTVESEHQTGSLPDAEYVVWKSALGKLATSVSEINKGLRAADGQTVVAQVNAAVDVVDALATKDVLKIPENKRFLYALALEGVRSTLNVLAATAD